AMYEQKAADIKRESSTQKNKLIEQRNKILQEKNAYKEKLDALVQKHTLSLSEKPFQQEVVKEHSMQEVFVMYSAHLEQIKIMLADQLLEKIKVELAIQD